MIKSPNNWYLRLGLTNWLTILGVLASCINNSAFAQSNIIPDQTMGEESSRVEFNYKGLPVELLRGGAIRGSNLFHSFKELNVSEDRQAFFAITNSNIKNILARVTGSNPSKIMGILGTIQIIQGNLGISDANLFLINPNGIIFGPNSLMSIGGSFIGTTADSINFADGTVFSATTPQTTPLLTLSVPLGLQMGKNPGDIQIQKQQLNQNQGIGVGSGKTLALLGGNITLDGGALIARNGEITLGGILGGGTIGLNLDSDRQTFTFPNDEYYANVSISNSAQVIANTSRNQNGRGIFIQAKQLVIEDGSQVSATNRGTGSASIINVKATESVTLTGSAIREDDRVLTTGLFTQTDGVGNAGKLQVTTGKLIIENGGTITAGTADNSQGNGGILNINADSIEISGRAANGENTSGIFARTRGTGKAGDVNITTNNLAIADGAQITVSGLENGEAGNLKINANSIKLDEGNILADTSNGDGGNITLQNFDLLFLHRNSLISAEARHGANGGNVTINAPDGFIVAAPPENSDILANASFGNGGNINITATGVYGLINSTQQPTNDNISEINATSEFGLNGTVELNTPDIQPDKGLTELPSIPMESELAQGCYDPGYAQSRFVIIGRGGLPPLPQQSLTPDSVRVGWVSLDADNHNREKQERIPNSSLNSSLNSNSNSSLNSNLKLQSIARVAQQSQNNNQIVEATGWIVNDLGEIVFTAGSNNSSSLQAPVSCEL